MKKDVDKDVVAMEHVRLLPGNNACVVQFSGPLLAGKKHFCRFHFGSASPEGIKMAMIKTMGVAMPIIRKVISNPDIFVIQFLNTAIPFKLFTYLMLTSILMLTDVHYGNEYPFALFNHDR